jgi:Cu/Ag efflux pump CusA
MFRWIVGSSLQYRFLAVVVAGALAIAGINQILSMPADVLPEFSPPYVEIQTEALGLSAKEVEQMITVPMEQDLLAGVAWLNVIRSESVPGLSSVLIYFEPGTDIYRARQLVGERIAQSAVGLPHVSKPPTMIQPLSSASRFMIVGLSSKEQSLIDLSVLARWTIVPRLMGVPGVAHVAIWGNRDRQLQVLVDPATLQEQGVTLEQIIKTTGNALWVSPLSFLEASSPGTGGFIDTPNQRLGVWHVLPISSAEELAQVPVEGTDGLILQDVARVVEDHQPLIGDAIINDSPNLLLVIEKLPGVNTLEVTRGVDTALASLQPGLPGVEFDASLFRPATFIEMAIANITQATVIAALLIILALGVLLNGWRSALISLASISISMVAALAVVFLRGATLNGMVVAGLVVALGLVIDDAVVDVERVLVRLRQNKLEGGLRSPEKVILDALSDVRSALFFAALITLLAVTPVFFVEGVSGALLRPLVVSYALAVMAAMVVALSVTPALCLILLSDKRLEHRESPLIPRIQQAYERMLSRTVKTPWLANLVIVFLLVAGLVVAPFLNWNQIVPAFQEPYLIVKLEGAPATSHPEMNRIVARLSEELRSLPGVRSVGAHVGRAVFGDKVVGINSAELWLGLDPVANREATVAAVQETVDGYTGVAHEVQTYLQQTLMQPRQSEAANVFTVRLYGENMDVMQAEAGKLTETLGGIKGVAGSKVTLPIVEPSLEIEVDLGIAQKYGIKPGEVRRIAAAYFSGILVGNLFEQQKIFDVVVWGVPEMRDSLSDVHNLPIQTPDGGQVRLGDVAKVKIIPSQTVIKHDAMSPYLDIDFTVQGRSINAVARDVETIIQDSTFPLEYHVEVLNDFADRQASQQRIAIAAIVALVGIFLILQASTGSWRMAFASFMILPASLAGGVLAAYFSNGTLSLAALFGLFAALGLATRNNLLTVSHYNRLEREKGETFGPNLILKGSRERVVPVVITTLTTMLALLPFILFGNIPGLEIFGPMSIVILGSLVTSTWLNLFALPAIYLHYGASREADLGFQPLVGTATAD